MKTLIIPVFLSVASAPGIAASASLRFDLTLQIDSMYVPDAIVVDTTATDGTGTVLDGTLALEDNIWGFSLPLSDQQVGDLVSFKTTISDEGTGQVLNCSLGSFNCKIAGDETTISADADSFQLMDINDAYLQIYGTTGVGDSFAMDYCSGYRCFYESGSFFLSGGDTQYSFTVMASSIAAVPLPASLPLLAVSVMGLGILRRRRALS